MTKAEKKVIKKKLRGIVISTNQNKTVSIRVETKKAHPLYGKIVKSHKKYLAHDEKNEAKVGDEVTIEETRPVSKNKNWAITKIFNKG